MFLFIIQFMIYVSTFSAMTIAALPNPDAGGALTNFLFMLVLTFCGVLVTKTQLPGFWVFMYRLSPCTYIVSGMLSTSVANTALTCSENELVRFNAPSGEDCSSYLESYLNETGGYLQPGTSLSNMCEVCPYSSTNQFLDTFNVSYGDSWRNFGILWAFIGFNVAFAFFTYWLGRVPKNKSLTGKKRKDGDKKDGDKKDGEKKDGDQKDGDKKEMQTTESKTDNSGTKGDSSKNYEDDGRKEQSRRRKSHHRRQRNKESYKDDLA